MKKPAPAKRRTPAAAALALPQHRPRTVTSKATYRRKPKHSQKETRHEN